MNKGHSIYKSFRIVILAWAWIWALAMIPMVSHSNGELIEFKSDEDRILYQQLIKELRCLVCQNQNLADSNAELANDLRKKTFDLISQGKDYDQIVAYMVNRYGDFVLYRPPLKRSTLALWISPFVILVLIVGIVIFNRRSSSPTTLDQFSDSDYKKAKNLIEKNLQD